MKATTLTLFLLASHSLFYLVPSPEETLTYHHWSKLRYGSDSGTLLHYQPPLVVFYEFDQVDERLGATGVFRLLLQPQLQVVAEEEEDDDDDNADGIYSDRSYSGDWASNDPVENPFGMDLPEFITADPKYFEVEKETPLLDYSDDYEAMPELVEVNYSDDYEAMPELVEDEDDDVRSLPGEEEVVGAVDSDPIPCSDEDPQPVQYYGPSPSEGYTSPAIYDDYGGEDSGLNGIRNSGD